MTKAELIDSIARKADLSKKNSGEALDATLASIKEALRRGDKVSLVGFGTFEVRSRKARKGRNPQTGATITIRAKKVPAFRAGKELKDAIR